jgi:hypothetical protein
VAASTRIEKFRKYRSDIAKMDDGNLNTPFSKKPQRAKPRTVAFSSSDLDNSKSLLNEKQSKQLPATSLFDSFDETKTNQWWPYVKAVLAALLVIGFILSVVFWLIGDLV